MEAAMKQFAPIMQAMYKTMGALATAFYEKYDADALPIITNVMEEAGVTNGKLAKNMIPGEGMKAVGSLFQMMMQMMEGGEIVEITDNKIHFKTLLCPLGIEGTSRELCEALMTSDQAMVRTMLGQDVEITIKESVAAGDASCEIIFAIQ
jgi:hypothetical protein